MHHTPADHRDKVTPGARGTGHPWWMAALCLAPIVALVAVTIFQVPISSVLFVGALLACPLLHLFMMRGHGHGPAALPRTAPTAIPPAGVESSRSRLLSAQANGSDAITNDVGGDVR